MARGKYLSLEEARKGETKGATIGRFCKEHPSQADERFWPGLEAAAKGAKLAPYVKGGKHGQKKDDAR